MINNGLIMVTRVCTRSLRKQKEPPTNLPGANVCVCIGDVGTSEAPPTPMLLLGRFGIFSTELPFSASAIAVAPMSPTTGTAASMDAKTITTIAMLDKCF